MFSSISLQYIHSADIIHRVSAMFDFCLTDVTLPLTLIGENYVCQGL